MVPLEPDCADKGRRIAVKREVVSVSFFIPRNLMSLWQAAMEKL